MKCTKITKVTKFEPQNILCGKRISRNKKQYWENSYERSRKCLPLLSLNIIIDIFKYTRNQFLF